jgi:hypothetical protein
MLMNGRLNEGETRPKGGLAAVGFGALAVVCCAGGPLIVGLIGGIALGTVLGVGAGVLAVSLVAALVIVRVRGAPDAPRAETRQDCGA